HQLNPVAPFSEYNPANNNPTVEYLPANTGGKALSDNYFRPIAGLGALTYNDLSGNSNYNSLQVSVRRPMTRHLSYGLAYTFSRTSTTNPQMNWTGGFEGARVNIVTNPQLPSGQASFVGGNTTIVQAPGANVNGTPGNQLLNEAAFVIPFPCSWTPGPTPQQGIGQNISC